MLFERPARAAGSGRVELLDLVAADAADDLDAAPQAGVLGELEDACRRRRRSRFGTA